MVVIMEKLISSDIPEFEDIRPYHDDEVREVIARLMKDKEFISVLARGLMPPVMRNSWIGNYATSLIFGRQSANLATVGACQDLMASYFEKLVKNTMESLTVEGVEYLDPIERYLFVSNHRDIVLDSACLNYFLRSRGHETARVAVGDNLFSWPYAADVMRINKSFIVKRSADNARESYRSLVRTSEFIWQSIKSGNSVWIAQKEGRSKDGYDRTDPAVLKMLALAHKEGGGIKELSRKVKIVPVSVSYEVDPCALRKAHELCVVQKVGQYEKSQSEDLESMLQGIVGYKGRVHLSISPPLAQQHESLGDLCQKIDEQIVSRIKVYPTHVEGVSRLAITDKSFAGLDGSGVPELEAAMTSMLADLDSCPEEEKTFFLLQYANVLKNKLEVVQQAPPLA